MASAVQLFGGAVGALAFVDIARRWGGPYPPRLAPTDDGRRERIEIAAMFLLALGASAYGVLVYRGVVSFNPGVLAVGDRTFRFVFLLGTLAAVIVPAVVELGVRERSVRDLGFRLPVAWRPALLLVGAGVLFGLAPLAFGFAGSEPTFALVLALYSPVFEEEFLFRGVLQTKLERVLSQERAWIASGLLFGLVHVPNDLFGPFWVASSGDPLVALGRLAQQTAKGLLYGLLFAKSRTLLAPVLAHYCSNKLAVIASTVWG